MRKILCSMIMLLCCSQFVVLADDCYDALSEAKSLYNSGNYAKAKSLFEYVKSECGSSYGDATNWIAKCNDALTPKLLLSRTSISVGASSGSTTITVTSNRTWELRNTSSSMFSVSKSGNTITIQNYSNSSTSSRNDYFDVATTDGSKSVRVYVYQNGKTASPSLSVSKTSISASASGITEYITVSCNTTWEVQYPSGNMYSVTRNGNSLTVKINANSSTESRSDYFNVKTTDGSIVKQIQLSQSGKSSTSTYSNASATIQKVWVDHNVYENGNKGMRIHIKMNVYNLRSKQGRAVAYFYTSSGTALVDRNNQYNTNTGKVCCPGNLNPGYDNTLYEDFTVFMPYYELHISTKGSYKFFVSIWDYSTSPHKELTQSDWIGFTYTP